MIASELDGSANPITRSSFSGHQTQPPEAGSRGTTTRTRPAFGSILGLGSGPISVPIRRLVIDLISLSLAAAPRSTSIPAKGLGPVGVAFNASTQPLRAMSFTRVTISAPESLRLGTLSRALSRSWAATSSSMTPSGVWLSILYAAVFCQASA